MVVKMAHEMGVSEATAGVFHRLFAEHAVERVVSIVIVNDVVPHLLRAFLLLLTNGALMRGPCRSLVAPMYVLLLGSLARASQRRTAEPAEIPGRVAPGALAETHVFLAIMAAHTKK